MNYELAKELKEAGFPNIEKIVSKEIEVKMVGLKVVGQFEKEHILGYKMPTLEELIEACGKDFMLTNECGVWEAWSNLRAKYIYDSVRMGESGAEHECQGKTPLEAVARLWLELNKK